MIFATRILVQIPLRYASYVAAKKNPIGLLKAELHTLFSKANFTAPFYIGFDEFEVAPNKFINAPSFGEIKYEVQCRVYHYKPEINEAILVRVVNIDQRLNLEAVYNNIPVMINRSQYPSANCKLKVTDKQKLLMIDTKSVKVNDVLKVKVLEIKATKFQDCIIRASFKGLAYGKLTWFQN